MRKLIPLTAIAAATLLLAACGNKPEATEAETTTEAVPESESSAMEAAPDAAVGAEDNMTAAENASVEAADNGSDDEASSSGVKPGSN